MQDDSTFQKPCVLFFGMQGTFSSPSLRALLASNSNVCAVVVPATPIPGRSQQAIQRREQPHGKRSSLPLVSHYPSITDIAWKQNIPVWEVSRLSDVTAYEILAAYNPDILCVACFSQRIPRSILDLPRLGCLNVHPSLLPAHRGPMPLFWTFRNGEATTGVTIHYLTEDLDMGAILAQQTISVPAGIDYDQLEMQCATIGGTLLANTICALYEGRATVTPQDEAKSSYESFPTHDDLVVNAEEWNAQHIYTFINGVKYWDEPVEIHTNGEVFFTRECISYSHRIIHKKIETSQVSTEYEREITCHDGSVTIRLDATTY